MQNKNMLKVWTIIMTRFSVTHVYLSVLQPNKSFYLSKRCLFQCHIVYHLY